MTKFRELTYLQNGNPRQRSSYRVLSELELFEKLKAYYPILTGTIPIGIDLPDSDLDIICTLKDPLAFQLMLDKLFSAYENYTSYITDQNEVIGRFDHDGCTIEIYGHSTPSHQQNAYLHMLKEDEILRTFGQAFKTTILKLKAEGLKTEPAFAKALGLKGDPYKSLLNYTIDPNYEP